MSYDTQDLSIDGGAPIELYEFAIENHRFYYTNAPEDIEVLGHVFLSRAITRTAITLTLSIIDNSNIDITLPIDDALSSLVNGLITPTTFTVEVYRLHTTDVDEEVRTIYPGFVMGISSGGKQTRLSLGSILQSHLSANVGIIKYSPVCNHEFGDARCGVDLDAISVLREVASIDLWALTLTAGAALADFAGGTVINVRTGEKRDIADVDGSTGLFVVGGFIDIVPGDMLKLAPGCDHSIDGDTGCFERYGNQTNFGGFPFVPRKNPFVEGFGEANYAGGEY